MRRYLPFIIVGVVALLTVGGGAMLYRAKRPAPLTSQKNQTLPRKDGGEKFHVRGGHDAPVTLEEFGDFQCPPCGTLAGVLGELERDYQSRLRVIFRHYPLPMHAHAAEAAYAAEAAGLQGRFWEMHDVLYREQSVWSKAADVGTVFNNYAGMIGLNIDRFKTDMQDPKVRAKVAADQRQGAERGVKSTPTIFVNNVELAPTALNKTGLRDAIDSAAKEKSSAKQPK
jgi:protein-disulfide isomerase